MEMESAESLINRNNESNEHINIMKGSKSHVEDYLDSFKNVPEDYYNQSTTPVMLGTTKVKQEWPNEEYSTSQGEDDEKEIEKSGRACDADAYEENSDEETIATFITSTGQQLALYAVEDSEEVFAVAVYSESGEPPTNFQFLMKADVERLIGEGAVRTVKKPQQMKKQTYQGELMTPRDKEIYRRSLRSSSTMPQLMKNSTHQSQHRCATPNEQSMCSKNISLDDRAQKIKMTIEEEEDTDINDDLTYQDILDNSYFLLEQEPLKGMDSKMVNDDQQKTQEQAVITQKDEEMIEQSSVQYILFGEDQSDSELTFEEIKKSLQHFDKNKKIKSLGRKSTEVEIAHPEKASTNEKMNLPSSPGMESLQTQEIITSEKPGCRVLQATSVVKHKHVPNALLGHKSSNVESTQTVFIQGSTALICCPISDIQGQMKTHCKESLDSSFKIKRPRKQQLTIVNRADSEIIIQPASMVSEDEEEQVTKKRGRRKKHLQEKLKSTIKLRGKFSRRISSHEEQSRIEVIEIDVENDGEDDEEEDEEEYEQKRGNIEEIITIEDGKEKGSSDKENEVIMVGDSDDDQSDKKKGDSGDEGEVVVEQQKKIIVPILKCDHCSRSFRQKRVLDTHSRVCAKSPNTRRPITTTSRTSSTKPNEATRSVLKKQYVCKICQEKFDVVVALARHVRSHYKKKETIASITDSMLTKKKEEITNTDTITISTPIITQDDKTKRQLTIEQKNKDRLLLYRGWNSKKMSCIDCGRWFASAALLSAHCLHHATKKSEKRIKRCQICKKLFRSRLIYIRHMRMHSNAKKLQKRIKRTRQSTTTITTLRKRGRPRKL